MSRARGPHSPSVVHALVWSWTCAEPSGGQVVGEPLEVGHPVGAAGDDAERVVGQAHDRQVLLEAAARG